MTATDDSNLAEHKGNNQWAEGLADELPANLRILSLIGSGGFANVYKAFHNDFQKPVAVKIIHTATTDNAFERFLSEAQLCAKKLQHPNIIRIYTFGLTKTRRPYSVMQLVDGVNLSTYFANTRYDWRHCLHLIEKVLLALEHAHKQGIIHRDLKPENILICSRNSEAGSSIPEVFLCDFGLAKDLNDHSQNLTSTGFTVGTPAYISPEQVYGQKVDERADVYSIGCILYEMISGSRPFSDETVTGIMRRQVFHRPARLLNAPPAVSAMVQTALEKNPDHRFFNATEFLEAVRAAMLNPNSPRNSKKFGMGRFARWSPALCRNLAIAALAMTALLGVAASLKIVRKPTAAAPKPYGADYLLRRAHEDYSAGLYKQADTLIESVANYDPQGAIHSPASTSLLQDLISVATREHDTDTLEAIDHLMDVSQKSDPDASLTYRQLLASAYSDCGRYDKYVEELGRMSQLLPAVSNNVLMNYSRTWRQSEYFDPENPDEFLPEQWPSKPNSASFQRKLVEHYCNCYLSLFGMDRACQLFAQHKKVLAEHAMQLANSLFDEEAARNDLRVLLLWRYYRASYYLANGEQEKVPAEITAGISAYNSAHDKLEKRPKLQASCAAVLSKIYWAAAQYCLRHDEVHAAVVRFVKARDFAKASNSADQSMLPVDEALADLFTTQAAHERGAHVQAKQFYEEAYDIALRQKPQDSVIIERLKKKRASLAAQN